MTSAGATILSSIQRAAFAWGKKNFGDKLTPETQLLGVGEEHGEAMSAIGDPDPSEFLDSVGDSAVFLMQFASLMGWDIGILWDARECRELEMPPRPWPILIGRIYHSYVKGRVQHYRGTQAEHDEKCKAAIATLLLHWEQRLAIQGHDFIAVVGLTWEKVSARDWRQETKTIDDPASDWQVPSTAYIPVALAGLGTLDVPALECGDQLMATSEGLVRFTPADQEALAEFELKQRIERGKFVDGLLANRRGG